MPDPPIPEHAEEGTDKGDTSAMIFATLRAGNRPQVRQQPPTLKIIKGGKTCDSERSIDA
jgi:hypothetical protein